jgi:hypothetical protein
MTNVFKSAVLVAALAFGAGSAAAGEYQFVFLNETSVPVLRMYVAPSSSEEWGDDILYDIGQVAPGTSATVTVTTIGDECLYDMRFEAPGGGESEQFEQNICTMGTFRLHD